jgi:hypothetical protein
MTRDPRARQYKNLYDIYLGRAEIGYPSEIMDQLEKDIHSLERLINYGYGCRKKGK